MAKQAHGMSSMLLIIKEMQIKTTKRYHLQSEWPSRKSLPITNAGEGMEKKGTLLHSSQEYKLVQPLRKTVWNFHRELKIELLQEPAIPLLGIYLDKTIIQKDTFMPMFEAALLTIAKTWRQAKCPSRDESIKKVWLIYNGLLLNYKKE